VTNSVEATDTRPFFVKTDLLNANNGLDEEQSFCFVSGYGDVIFVLGEKEVLTWHSPVGALLI